MTPNWHVITGGPSSGKTTLLKVLAAKDVHTFPEVARTVIDEAVANGIPVEELRRDERKFQDIVLLKKKLLEESHDPSKLTFLDRGIHDSLAYCQMYGWDLSKEQAAVLEQAKYKHVFLLDSLPNFEKDYARTEDIGFAQKISNYLRDAYKKHGMPVISVPVMPPEQRAQFILDYIGYKSDGGQA